MGDTDLYTRNLITDINYTIPTANLSIPYNRTVAAIGDSITAHNTIGGSGNWSSANYGNRYISFGYLSFLRSISRNCFDFDGNANFGVSGDTSAMVLARVPAALKASNAAVWFVMCGINDVLTTPANVASTLNNIQNIVQSILNSHRQVILMIPTNAGDTNNTSNRKNATALALYQTLRHRMKVTFGSMTGVALVDTWPAYTDPLSTLGDNIVGQTYDGIHPSPAGAFSLACQQLLNIVTTLYSPRSFLPGSNSDVYDATNNPAGSLIANPFFSGTGGSAGTGGSGSVATSWSGTNGGETGHTRTYSIISAAASFSGIETPFTFNGNNYAGSQTKLWQQCVFGGTAAGTADVNFLFQTITYVAGETIQAAIEYEVDAGATGIMAFFLRLYNSSDFTIGGIDMHYSGNQLYIPAVAYSGTMLTPPITLPGPTYGMTLGVSARLISGQAINGTFRVRAATVFQP